MKPSKADATHYDTWLKSYLKIGEEVVYEWTGDCWRVLPGMPSDFKRSALIRDISTENMLYDTAEAADKARGFERNPSSADNRQVGGDHYKKMKLQPWELFANIFNEDEQIGFYLGNVYKYLMRYNSKNGLQDLEKSKHYLEKLIEVKRGQRGER